MQCHFVCEWEMWRFNNHDSCSSLFWDQKTAIHKPFCLPSKFRCHHYFYHYHYYHQKNKMTAKFWALASIFLPTPNLPSLRSPAVFCHTWWWLLIDLSQHFHTGQLLLTVFFSDTSRYKKGCSNKLVPYVQGYNGHDYWTSGNRLGTDMLIWMSSGVTFNATFDYMRKAPSNELDNSTNGPTGEESTESNLRASVKPSARRARHRQGWEH